MKANQGATLFLDRDGVINQRIQGGYVTQPSQLEYIEGAMAAVRQLNSKFDYTLIITNQQGIGKGLMTEEDLASIHDQLRSDFKAHGATIDGIYHCPQLASRVDNCRKPAPEMAYRAQRDFPAIDFQKSVMMGDQVSDLEFGRRLDMQTIWISRTTQPSEVPASDLYDFQFSSLSKAATQWERWGGKS